MEARVRLALGIVLTAGLAAVAQTNTFQPAAGTAAQSSNGSLPAFEVATIKPIAPNGIHMLGVDVLPGGKVVIGAVTLKDLIVIAFKQEYFQESGGEPWIAHDRYDIVALPPENVREHITDLRHTSYSIDDDTLRQMLQALLIDRFQLRFHTETQTGAVYLLEKNGKTLRLRPVKTKSADASGSQVTRLPSGRAGFVFGRWSISDTSMSELAGMATSVLQRPVFDRTGLSGSFDYKSRVQGDQANMTNNPTGSFLTFISETGLKLKSAKGPVETFVIDHAERPSPN